MSLHHTVALASRTISLRLQLHHRQQDMRRMLLIVIDLLLRFDEVGIDFVVASGVQVARKGRKRCGRDLYAEAAARWDSDPRLPKVEWVLVDLVRFQHLWLPRGMAETCADLTLGELEDLSFLVDFHDSHEPVGVACRR